MVAGDEAHLFVKALGVLTSGVGGQLYQPTIRRLRLINRPQHHFLADPLAAQITANAHGFYLQPFFGLLADAGNKGQLKRADGLPIALHQQDTVVGVCIDFSEGFQI